MVLSADETGIQPLLELEGAWRTFHMGEVDVNAVVDVNLEIRSGEFMVVLGPSGSGKSTLLNLIGGIDRSTRGQVRFSGHDLGSMSDSELTRYRRERVGFIFQFYNLIPTLTALENVLVATELITDPLDAAEALAHVNLSERMDHFPAQLSGGEQQRVAIARALSKKPILLLADEPTGALDLPAARNVLAVLQKLSAQQNLTVVLITHNPAIAGIAHRVVRMVSGRIAESTENPQPIAAAQVSW